MSCCDYVAIKRGNGQMIIVNFATGNYLRGQQRLQKSLNGHKCMLFRDYAEIGSPTHQESPYEFKVHAIEKGFEVDDNVMWLDASVYMVKPLTHLEDLIKTQGYWLEEAGHYVGRWCNQFTRNYFKLTEQEAFQGPGGMTMFSAGYIGFNKNSPIAKEYLRQWKAAALAGCFRGDWLDHRHDMVVGSIIASRLGMKYERGGSNVSYIGPGYSPPEPQVCLHLQGV